MRGVERSKFAYTHSPSLTCGLQRVALIADEVHRSHGRQLTRSLHGCLTGETKQTSALSYFGFTSTPNARGAGLWC